MTQRWKSSHGVSVAIRGDGPAVFLMHGIGGNSNSCAPLAELLARAGYSTYSWDAPGYGASDDPTQEFIEHDVVLLEILEELKLTSVHLFGTSWGGVIGAQAVNRNPEIFSSLIMVDSTRGSGTTEVGAQAMLARHIELAEVGAAQFAAARAGRLVSPKAAPELVQAVENDMAKVRVPGYKAAAAMMARSNNQEILGQITIPTLIAVGADDIVTGVEESQLLAELVDNSQFRIIEDAGHAALQEKPKDMANVMLEFWTHHNT